MTHIPTGARADTATAAAFAQPGSRRQVWRTLSSADKGGKMRSFWSLSLQRRLAIAIGLLVVPVLTTAIWAAVSTLRERAAELGDQTRLVAFTTAAYVNHDFTNLEGEVALLQSNRDVQALDRDAITRLLGDITLGRPMV